MIFIVAPVAVVAAPMILLAVRVFKEATLRVFKRRGKLVVVKWVWCFFVKMCRKLWPDVASVKNLFLLLFVTMEKSID